MVGDFVAHLLLAVICAFLCSCQQRLVYPAAEWERITDPESVGFSIEKFETSHAHLDTLPSTGMVVVVGGKILFENGDIADRSYIASVRKSVLAMLFGKYVENGIIDLEKTLADLDKTDHGGLSDQEKEAIIADPFKGAYTGIGAGG